MKTIDFLRKLSQSDKSKNENFSKYSKADEYLKKPFPNNKSQPDDICPYVETENNMSWEQVSNTQDEETSETQTDINNVKDMQMSDDGIEMLKQLEGCVKIGNRHVIYDDKNGKPVNVNETLPSGATIGYGHLVKSGETFKNGITEKVATELLRSDIAIAERAIRDNIYVSLSQNQFDALVALVYNIGTKNFANSTIVKYINNPDFHSSTYPDLESAWKAWNLYQGKVSKGLTKRRQKEWDMYNAG